MILEDLPVRVHIKKGKADNFHVTYFCHLTGKEVRVTRRVAGVLNSKVEAEEWAKLNLATYLKNRKKFKDRDGWRVNRNIVRLFNEYKEVRQVLRERSCAGEFSQLSCYIFPYFIEVLKLPNPNKWCEYGEEFNSWLQKEARTLDGRKLSFGSAKRAISVANQFLLWLKRKKQIDRRSYRKFECHSIVKRDPTPITRLIDEKDFLRIHKYLEVRYPVYADMWLLQGKTGMRANEIPGIAMHWLSNECSEEIKKEFVDRGFQVYGSIYLESQLEKRYVARNPDGSLNRVPLKDREAIGASWARTIPIVCEKLWEMLLDRYEQQCALWEKKDFGNQKLSYLIFGKTEYRNYLKVVHEAQTKLRLEVTGTHVLRHTVATDWALKKVSGKIAEVVLGHKGQAQERYNHVVEMINKERANFEAMPILRKNVEK